MKESNNSRKLELIPITEQTDSDEALIQLAESLKKAGFNIVDDLNKMPKQQPKG